MKLKDWLEHVGMSGREFAPLIGKKEAYISLLRNEKALPSLKTALIIDKETNGMVRPKDWISI